MPARDHGPRLTVVVLAALLVLVLAVVLGVRSILNHVAPTAGGHASFVEARGHAGLRTAPQPDLSVYRAEKQAQLEATGPVAGAPGFMRIPIDRAMTLMTERGLRSRTSSEKRTP